MEHGKFRPLIGKRRTLGTSFSVRASARFGTIRAAGYLAAAALLIQSPLQLQAVPLFYGGDWNFGASYANERNTAVSDCRIYDDFTVNGTGWRVSSLSSVSFLQGSPSSATQSYYEIRSGVSSGSGGSLISSGTISSAVSLAFVQFGNPYYLNTATLPSTLTLTPGTYWMTLVPIGTGSGRAYLNTTSGFSGIGTPLGNGNSFITTPNTFTGGFGPYTFQPFNASFVTGGNWDFQYGVQGTVAGSIWTNPAGGSWFAGSNWNGGVPSAASNAVFDLNNTYTVNFTANADAKAVNVFGGTVTFNLGGNTLSQSAPLNVNGGSGGTVSLTVNGSAGSAMTPTYFNIGDNTGHGLAVIDGTTITTSDTATTHNVGGSGFHGKLTLQNNAVMSTAGTLQVAHSGFNTTNGTLEIRSGSQVTAPALNMAGSGGTAVGTLIVDAARLNVTGNASLSGTFGGQGAGSSTLTIQNGGSVTVGGTTKVWNNGRINLAGGTLTTGTLDTVATPSRFNWTAGTLDLTASNLRLMNGQTLGSDLALGAGKALLIREGFTLGVGDSSAGTLNVSGGYVGLEESFSAGQLAGGNGTILVSAGVINTAGALYLGGNTVNNGGGNGRLILSGGSVNVAATTKAYSTGTLIVTGGSLTTQSLDLGSAGSFSHTGGTITVNGGELKPKIGTVPVRVTGYSTPINYSNSFDVNGIAVANLRLQGGGTINNSSLMFVGHSGLAGTFAAMDQTTSVTVSELYLGIGRNLDGSLAGIGTMTVFGGASILCTSSTVGLDIGQNGGAGFGTISGIGSSVSMPTFGANAIIGQSGFFVDGAQTDFRPSAGTLVITDGGLLNVSTVLQVGSSGAEGTMSVSGAALNVGNTIHIGINATSAGSTIHRGKGLLSVSNGGSVTTRTTNVGINGGQGSVTISGVGSSWTTINSSFNVGESGGPQSGTLSVSDSASLSVDRTLNINSAGMMSLHSLGRVTVGTLDLHGSASRLAWTGGTLKINTFAPAADGLLTVPNTGTLGGTGNIQRPVTVFAGGVLSPGNSVGALTTANLNLNSASDYFIELDLNANTADKTVVNGTVQLNGVADGLGGTVGGAKLTFVFLSGGVPPLGAPRSFVVVENDSTDAVSGLFEGILENVMYTRPGGVMFSVDYTSGSGGNDITLTIHEVPEPAAVGLLPLAVGLMRRRRSVVATS